MTAITYQPRKSGSAILIIIIALCLIAALAAVQSEVTRRSHAVAKHGSPLATHARQCNQRGRVNQIWYSFQRGTKIELCEMNLDDWSSQDKTWTLRVIDAKTKEEITIFGHTGDYNSVEDYLIRQLYRWIE